MREEKEVNRMNIILNKLLSRDQVQEVLGCGKNTFYKLCKQPSFPVVHVGNKLMVDADGLKDWIEQYKI